MSDPVRPLEAYGAYKLLHGEFRMSASSGAATTIAAAAPMFSARWSSTTGKRAVIRYLRADFTLTTAFGTAQPMGVDLIIARAFTASDTAGTAIDMGSTITGSGKLRTGQDASLFAANSTRIATAAALTAGTRTLDANPISQGKAHMAALGAQYSIVLLDTRWGVTSVNAARAPIVLAQDEGIVVRNTILMGATGVGTFDITMEWDEATF